MVQVQVFIGIQRLYSKSQVLQEVTGRQKETNFSKEEVGWDNIKPNRRRVCLYCMTLSVFPSFWNVSFFLLGPFHCSCWLFSCREQILSLPITIERLTPLLGTFCRLDFISIYLDALPVDLIFLVSHLSALPKKLRTANLHLTQMLT